VKAMLLAAGLGKRLRPITDRIPKPLLKAGDRTLIEHQLENLRKAGVLEVVINLHHLGDQIVDKLGDGSACGVSIDYSRETELLETGGGIKQALPMLGDEPFLVVSADTYIEYDFSRLPPTLPDDCLGCLLMTDNPAHHPEGDFAIGDDGVLLSEGNCYTYTGIGVLAPDLVRDESLTAFKLRKVWDEAIADGRMTGIRHQGFWCDVGTEERYLELQKHLSTERRHQ